MAFELFRSVNRFHKCCLSGALMQTFYDLYISIDVSLYMISTVQCGNHTGEVMKMTKTGADSLNMNSLTSCMTHVTAPIQVHGILFIFKSHTKNSIKYCFCVFPGEVLASMIINYLQSMTAQSTEQDRLVALRQLLDPNCQDPPVSREVFHSKMREWITQCSQDR